MITHHLKVASRSLMKYKVQSFVSILGMAAGLVSFVFSAFWIRYELTYDAFHRDADRIYLVRGNDPLGLVSKQSTLPIPFLHHIQENCPEVEETSYALCQPSKVSFDNQMQDVVSCAADTSFMRMFDIRIIQGSANFLTGKEYAVTEAKAKEWFGSVEAALGKEVQLNGRSIMIGAVVNGWGKHSSFYFDLFVRQPIEPWNDSSCLLVKLKSGTDPEALAHFLETHLPKEMTQEDSPVSQIYLTPLTRLHTDDSFMREDGKIVFNYIVYFCVIGVLIIWCVLINYLMIFVNRIRIRKKELMLRKVNGASNWSLMGLLLTEFVLSFVMSCLLGGWTIEVLSPVFQSYAQIECSVSFLWMNVLAYILLVFLLSLLLLSIPIYLFQRRSIQRSLTFTAGKRSENLLRKVSVCLQLFICLLLISVTVIMNRQIDLMQKKDIGMEHHNIASVSIWGRGADMNAWKEKIASLPMVTEVLEPKFFPMVGVGAMTFMELERWEGQETPVEKKLLCELILSDESFFRFYGFQLLIGKGIDEQAKETDVVITESTAHHLGWQTEEAVGKQIYQDEEKALTVIGVVKDSQYRSPSSDTPNTLFVHTNTASYQWFRASVLFKFKEGTWPECRQRIETMYQQECPTLMLRLFNEEEVFQNYIRSEMVLRSILLFASAMCVLVTILGIYSLIHLTCEERRKEIAIRKVNGATATIISRMFLLEYLSLFVVASLLAFPLAYVVMRHWLDTYNRQIVLSGEIFLWVFLGVGFLVVCMIANRIRKAAQENPADVIKQE